MHCTRVCYIFSIVSFKFPSCKSLPRHQYQYCRASCLYPNAKRLSIMSSFLPLMQLGSVLTGQPTESGKIASDTYEGERVTPRMSSSRFNTPSTQTPVAPSSPWDQFKPFGRKTQSAPNSPPTLSEENDGFQELHRPKGKRRVSDPGARHRSYEPRGSTNKGISRSPFAGFTAYFSGSPRSSPRMDTMSHSPLLHTVNEDDDEEHNYFSQPSQPVDALGISIFDSPAAQQSTVEVVSSTQPKPLPKRISFTPSPYHYVVTPDLTRATNSPVSEQSSPRTPRTPRTPRESPSAKPSPKPRQSPHLVDVSFRSPTIKQTTSYTDIFSNIMTPGSTTIYCAESPALSCTSDNYGEGSDSIELSDATKLSKHKAESVAIQPARPLVSTPKLAEQERAVRQWSAQGSGSWVRRSSVYSNSGKQEHNAWPTSRNTGILTV